MFDLGMQKENYWFRYRAGAIIVEDGCVLLVTNSNEDYYYSVGGGFVVDEDAVGEDRIKLDDTVLRHPFRTGDELLRRTRETGLSVSALMLENERAWRSEAEVRAGLLEIWEGMRAMWG